MRKYLVSHGHIWKRSKLQITNGEHRNFEFKVFIANDIRNMKTISLKQLCIDIYGSNLISVNLMDFRLWPVTSDFKRMISMVYYSLISGLVAALICRWYFRNCSDDSNPMLTICRITLIYQRGRLKKKPANQWKLRPQYIDLSCLHSAKKMRIHSSVILIRYQIH